MLTQQRQSFILDLLSQNGIVHTAELVEKMEVSSETIRKDLSHLEKTEKLVRIHGGAIPIEDNNNTPYIPFRIRNTQYLEAKDSITTYAASLIEENQVIALDYGSTSQMMAFALRKRFQSLTIITNSVQNALILNDCPKYTVILTGGILDKEELTLSNDFSSLLDHFHIDVLFMTVSGVDSKAGLTDMQISAAKIQNEMHNASLKTYVLADSSKFGHASLVKICKIQDVDAIITDRGVSDATQKEIKAAGGNLIVVP